MRCSSTIAFVAGAIALFAVGSAPSAGAQTTDDGRAVTIDFEVGDFDASERDWPITVVNVSGDLEAAELFVVELRSGDGAVIWAGEGVYSPPTTSVTVDTFVAVGDVDEAAIGQQLPGEPTTTTTTRTPAAPAVAGVVVTNPPPPPTPSTPPSTRPSGPPGQEAPELAAPPSVAGDVTSTPDAPLPRQGSGLVGVGQLALSMVIAVVFVAILFRTPLPSATTQRWRR